MNKKEIEIGENLGCMIVLIIGIICITLMVIFGS
jgi:hypothetical protein